ncbi:MAG: hypothetical protein NC093_10370 [Alistipes sp.]|nr:hypothetical protein [Alistipes sp.]
MSAIRTPKKKVLIGNFEKLGTEIQIHVKQGSKTDFITIMELLSIIYKKPIDAIFISFNDGSTAQMRHDERNLRDRD